MSDDDTVERHQADRHPDQIEAAYRILERRDFAAGYRNPGLPGTFRQANGERPQHVGVGGLDRDVIDHRQRARTDANQIVDVHRDAVDADRVVFLHHVGDDRFRANAVGADRQPDPAADVDDIGEIADVERHRAGLPRRRPGPFYRGDDPAEPGLDDCGIDPGFAIVVLRGHWRLRRRRVRAAGAFLSGVRAPGNTIQRLSHARLSLGDCTARTDYSPTD